MLIKLKKLLETKNLVYQIDFYKGTSKTKNVDLVRFLELKLIAF